MKSKRFLISLLAFVFFSKTRIFSSEICPGCPLLGPQVTEPDFNPAYLTESLTGPVANEVLFACEWIGNRCRMNVYSFNIIQLVNKKYHQRSKKNQFLILVIPSPDLMERVRIITGAVPIATPSNDTESSVDS